MKSVCVSRVSKLTLLALSTTAAWGLVYVTGAVASENPLVQGTWGTPEVTANTANEVNETAIANPVVMPETAVGTATPPQSMPSVADPKVLTELSFSSRLSAIAPPEMTAPSASVPSAAVPVQSASVQMAAAEPDVEPAIALQPELAQAIAPPEMAQQPEAFSAPLAVPTGTAELAQAATFPDLAGNWAEPFIRALAARNLVAGFPDGTFRPNEAVTRAQFAAMIRRAFNQPAVRGSVNFSDVSSEYWAYTAIQMAYQMGFLSGYPDGTFQPEQVTPRVQALVAIASGLDLSADDIAAILNTYFADANQIPGYARNQVAAATENRIVVNYPNPQLLQPNQVATRADAAAFIYQALVNLGQLPPVPEGAPVAQYIVGPPIEVAMPEPEPEPEVNGPTAAEITAIRTQLTELSDDGDFGDVFQGSPSITIANPAGYGADQNTVFLGATFQSDVRESDKEDGAAVIGIGLGDSREVIGAEVSYTFASFGENRDFGTGGFNLKLHRQFRNDWAVAVGWNGFATTGDTDFNDSFYGVVTHILRTRPNVNSFFSRVALTAGVGNGQFQTIEDFEEDSDDFNPFGSIAVRVAQPVSVITEWTGQDLAVGLSIVPIEDLAWVITPAFRDIAGDDVDEARFVVGTGISFQF